MMIQGCQGPTVLSKNASIQELGCHDKDLHPSLLITLCSGPLVCLPFLLISSIVPSITPNIQVLVSRSVLIFDLRGLYRTGLGHNKSLNRKSNWHRDWWSHSALPLPLPLPLSLCSGPCGNHKDSLPSLANTYNGLLPLTFMMAGKSPHQLNTQER